MEERDPEMLLTPLAQTAEAMNAPITAPALFTPSESSSKGLVPFAGVQDVTWQGKVARTWDELARRHAGCVRASEQQVVGEVPTGVPIGVPTGVPTSSSSSLSSLAASAVVPCLRQAVESVRRRAREERALGSGRRVHVLVTGSLYLVGDMLRVLGRAG
jgi:folylpolyglutamate synthase